MSIRETSLKLILEILDMGFKVIIMPPSQSSLTTYLLFALLC